MEIFENHLVSDKAKLQEFLFIGSNGVSSSVRR